MGVRQLAILLWKNYRLLRADLLKYVIALSFPMGALYVIIYLKNLNPQQTVVTPPCIYADNYFLSSGPELFTKDVLCGKKRCLDAYSNGSNSKNVRYLYTSGRWKSVLREVVTFIKSARRIGISRIAQDFTNFTEMLYGLECNLLLSNLMDQNKFSTLSLGGGTTIDFKKFILAVKEFSEHGFGIYEDSMFNAICQRDISCVTFNPVSDKNKICKQLSHFSEEFVRILRYISYEKFYDEIIRCANATQAETLSTLNLTLGDDITKLRAELENMEESSKFLKNHFSTEVRDFIDLGLILCGTKKPVYPLYQPESETCQSLFSGTNLYFLTKNLRFKPSNDLVKNISNEIYSSLAALTTFMELFGNVSMALDEIEEFLQSKLIKNLKIALPVWFTSSPSKPLKFFNSFFLASSEFHIEKVIDTMKVQSVVLKRAIECISPNFVELENHLSAKSSNISNLLASVTFYSNDTSSLRYEISQPGEDAEDMWDENVENPKVSKYEENGFAFVQDLVDHAFMKLRDGNDSVGALFRHFPQSCYKDVMQLDIYGLTFLIIVLPWLYPMAKFAKEIGYEYESRLKDYMKVMGMSNYLYWLSWFITDGALLLAASGTIVYLLKDKQLFEKNSEAVLYLYVSGLLVSMLSKTFLITAIVRKSTNVTVATLVILYVYHYVSGKIEEILVKNSALIFIGFVPWNHAWNQIVRYEFYKDGVTMSNFFVHPYSATCPSIFSCCAVMFIDVAFDMMVILMLDAYRTDGLFKSSIYQIKKSLTKKKKENVDDDIKKNSENKENVNQNFNDLKEDSSSKPESQSREGKSVEESGVSVVDLVKQYGWYSQPAVDHLTVNFYKDQITAFLGQNGAGKSTVMHIMSGMIKATHGTIYVNGMDVNTKLSVIQKQLSFCPQHNILFDGLTVKEHMYFFGYLRNLSRDVIQKESTKLMEDMNMITHLNKKASNLSGGAKRILSIGLAYLGSPATIILDEPTSGIDTQTTRQIWNLVQSYRKGHTTIISTHSMDEADIISDRIVVIWKGRLAASGTSMELKKKFGKGYKLIIELMPPASNEQLNANKPNKSDSITKLVLQSVPDSTLDIESKVANELFYTLPIKEDTYAPFVKLFRDINSKKTELGIKHFGVSSPGLEEVFVKINEDAQMEQFNVRETEEFESYPAMGEKRSLLALSQMKAMLIKRFIFFRRSKITILTQVVVPLLLLYVYLMSNFGKFTWFSSGQTSVTIHPWMMARDTEVMLRTFVAHEPGLDWDPSSIERTFVDEKGMSVRCAKNFKIKGFPCKRTSKALKSISYPPRYEVNETTCDCTACPREKKVPLSVDVNGMYVLENLTHYNITRYLISTASENDVRLGGLEFAEDFDISFAEEVIQNFLELNIEVLSYTGYRTGRLQAWLNRLNSSDNTRRQLVRIWYTNYAKPSLPSFLNVLNNAALRSSSVSRDAYIAISESPLLTGEANDMNDLIMPYIALGIYSFSLSIVAASFVFFIMIERKTGFNHLQIVSGTHPLIYLMSNFIWDMTIFVIFLALAIGGMVYFLPQDSFIRHLKLPLTATSLSFGLSMIPFCYLSTIIFKDSTNAFLMILALQCYTIPRSGLGFMKLVNHSDYYHVVPGLSYGMSVFYSLTRNESEKGEVMDPYISYLWLQSVGFLFLIFLIPFIFVIMNALYKGIIGMPKDDSKDDDDVEKEKRRLSIGDFNDDLVVLRNLKKVYFGGIFQSCYNVLARRSIVMKYAVRGVSFGVKRGECFGLMGVNGAGKTTTFKMITKEVIPSSGNIYFNSSSSRKTPDRHCIGYCPQFDAFCSLMTVKEHINMFTTLSGISKTSRVLQWALQSFGIKKFANYFPDQLSGGNRRKLSVALSIIGNADLICLDEPSAGVDPQARSYIRMAVEDATELGRSVMMITHSMEECEALCNRVTIMVNGKLKCLGTLQHLKTKFNKGYNITLRIDPKKQKVDDSIEELKEFMRKNMPDAELIKTHHSVLTYQAPVDTNLLLPALELLNAAKKSGICEDFSMNQTTLEQVFVGFAEQGE